MKKVLAIVLALVMVLSFAACGGKDDKGSTTLKEVKGVTAPKFSVIVCGVKITNEDMAAYPLYEVTANTVNSSGTAHTNVYIGFKFTDVLEAAEITGTLGKVSGKCTDDHEIAYEGDVKAEGVLLAVSKDGKQFKNAPWFAPCTSGTTGDYAQDVSWLAIEGGSSPKATENPEQGGEKKDDVITELREPVAEDKTDKITFKSFKFKVNGKEVTNADLDGLKIFRITVTTQNSKGTITEAKYSGYVLKDVLEKLGIKGAKSVKAVANDGYESELSADDLASDLTIIAIEKDKAMSEDGSVWVAPCNQTSSGKYGKGIVEIKAE